MKTINKITAILLAMASLCVSSCYDDTELVESIKDLNERVTALEQKMIENIAAVQSMISVGSIASWRYNAETGEGVITLVDGSTIKIDQRISGYSIITVEKGEDGVYYWAICRDGVNIPLTVDNKRVPVTVTPALKISSDNEWMISVDGGKTWINTGISYFTGEQPGEDSDDPVTEAILFEKVEKVDDCLMITLVGGEVIKVAIVGEAVFKADADQLWFSRFSMEKAVAVEMANVKAYTITEKPEGWKARIEDDAYLYVTSPENFTDYPDHGTVKVLAVFDNGAAPEIMCVDVAYEPCFTLSRANGVVSVALSEHTGEDFTGYLMTGWEAGAYTPEAALAWLNENAGTATPYQGTATYQLEDIISGYSMLEEYVVFAAPYLPASQVAQGKMKYELSDIVSVRTLAVSDTWTIANLKFDSADLYAVMPVTEFYGGFQMYDRWLGQARADMMELLSQESGVVCTDVKYQGHVSGFPYGDEPQVLIPGTEYVLWYAPVVADRPYVAEDFVEYTFITPDITPDASVPAPGFEISDVTSSGFTARVTPAGSYYKTYSVIVKTAAVAELSEKDVVKYIIDAGVSSEGADAVTLSKASFSPEDEVCLLSVSLTEAGGYGTIVNEKVPLEALVFTGDLGVTVSGYECNEEGTATLELTFTGNPVTMTYMVASYSFFQDEQLQQFLALEQLDELVKVEVSKLDGKLVLAGLPSGVDHTLFAIVTDAQGRHSYLSKYDFTPAISIDYIMSSDPDYTYGMPQISGKLTSNTFKMKVDMPEECQRYWLFCGDSEYLPGDVLSQTDTMVNMGLELSGETVHTESVSLTYGNVYSYTRIYMVWQDIKGGYHAIYEYNPNK